MIAVGGLVLIGALAAFGATVERDWDRYVTSLIAAAAGAGGMMYGPIQIVEALPWSMPDEASAASSWTELLQMVLAGAMGIGAAMIGMVGCLGLLTQAATGVTSAARGVWSHRAAVAAAAERRRSRWETAEQEYNEVRAAYAAAVTDLIRVLDEPALSDVDEQPTAAFLDALASADFRHHEQVPADDAAVDRFVDAVQALGRTWKDAQHHARELGTARFGTEQAETIRRARRLLQRAALSTTGQDEAQELHARARDVLQPVLHLPHGAPAALENRSRLALPSAESER